MITEEKLNKIYESLIISSELTTDKLNEFGFNSKDINKLVEQGYLIKTKRGLYSFIDIDDLILYGKKMLAIGKREKANNIFKACVELDPNHIDANFKLFVSSIENKDYELAFKCFDVLAKTTNVEYFKDYNLYLYMLNMVTEIPQKYKFYVRNLKIEDLIRYKNNPEQSRLIRTIMERKFTYALKIHKEITKDFSIRDLAIKKLIYQCAIIEANNKKMMLDLIKDKQYGDLYAYLEEMQLKRGLSYYEKIIFKLADVILELEFTEEIPEILPVDSTNIFKIIESNNFFLALELSKNHSIENEKNHIELLLQDICSIIERINKKRGKKHFVLEDSQQSLKIIEKAKLYRDKTELDREDFKLDREYIKEQYKQLVNGDGVLLLPPMEPERRARIHKIIEGYSDVVSFSVREGYERRIVLRYKPYISGGISIGENYTNGCKAYKEGNYDEALEYFTKLLYFGNPNSKVYTKLGITYYKKRKRQVALKYFIIATELNKIDGKGIDFSEMIEKIIGVENLKKMDFEVNIEEFENDLELNYGVDNYEEIKDYFITNGGFNISRIKERFDLTPEELDCVCLMYARDLYSEGRYALGDTVLKIFEKSKNKTKDNSKLWAEIKKNKKFYFNRVQENGRQLIFGSKK